MQEDLPGANLLLAELVPEEVYTIGDSTFEFQLPYRDMEMWSERRLANRPRR